MNYSLPKILGKCQLNMIKTGFSLQIPKLSNYGTKNQEILELKCRMFTLSQKMSEIFNFQGLKNMNIQERPILPIWNSTTQNQNSFGKSLKSSDQINVENPTSWIMKNIVDLLASLDDVSSYNFAATHLWKRSIFSILWDEDVFLRNKSWARLWVWDFSAFSWDFRDCFVPYS